MDSHLDEIYESSRWTCELPSSYPRQYSNSNICQFFSFNGRRHHLEGVRPLLVRGPCKHTYDECSLPRLRFDSCNWLIVCRLPGCLRTKTENVSDWNASTAPAVLSPQWYHLRNTRALHSVPGSSLIDRLHVAIQYACGKKCTLSHEPLPVIFDW